MSQHVIRNTAVVAAFTSLSRVLGLVREMFQSRLIGAGWEQSAFALAFAIPNMARRLFGEGALTAAFVPVFRGELEADKSLERARHLARAVLTMAVLMLASIVVLSVIGITGALFWEELFSERTKLALRLTRLLIPYMLFICAGAFGMGVLNAFGRFAAAAMMPSILNVFWIAGLAAVCFFPGLSVTARIEVVCVAILLAGFMQMSFMFHGMAKKGIAPKPIFKGWGDAPVRLVWRNMAVACIGAGAVQINYLLDQILAQWASPWAAGVIGYADRLMELPLGIVGTAFGTVLLPTFSAAFAKGDVSLARESFISSARSMLFVVLPAAAGLVALSPEITSLIYKGGAFDDVAVVRVARAVACYSLGLSFFCFMKTIIPWFHAQKDMKTPLKVAVRMVFANATLNILAVWLLPVEWRHVGLAASTVVCSAASCVCLAVIASRRNGPLGMRMLVRPVVMMAGSSLAMVLAIISVRDMLSGLSMGIGAQLAVLIPLGAVAYLAIEAVLDRSSLRLMLKDLRHGR